MTKNFKKGDKVYIEDSDYTAIRKAIDRKGFLTIKSIERSTFQYNFMLVIFKETGKIQYPLPNEKLTMYDPPKFKEGQRVSILHPEKFYDINKIMDTQGYVTVLSIRSARRNNVAYYIIRFQETNGSYAMPKEDIQPYIPFSPGDKVVLLSLTGIKPVDDEFKRRGHLLIENVVDHVNGMLVVKFKGIYRDNISVAVAESNLAKHVDLKIGDRIKIPTVKECGLSLSEFLSHFTGMAEYLTIRSVRLLKCQEQWSWDVSFVEQPALSTLSFQFLYSELELYKPKTNKEEVDKLKEPAADMKYIDSTMLVYVLAQTKMNIDKQTCCCKDLLYHKTADTYFVSVNPSLIQSHCELNTRVCFGLQDDKFVQDKLLGIFPSRKKPFVFETFDTDECIYAIEAPKIKLSKEEVLEKFGLPKNTEFILV